MKRPEDMPNRLECAYCRRHKSHGGECRGKSDNRYEEGCLYLEMDNRGCIRRDDLVLPYKLYSEIKPVGVWDDNWSIYGEDTEVKIINIKALNWDTKKGLLKVTAECLYYINDLSDEYKNNKSRKEKQLKFKVIKGNK